MRVPSPSASYPSVLGKAAMCCVLGEAGPAGSTSDISWLNTSIETDELLAPHQGRR